MYLDQIDIAKKRVLIRVDFNVPMNAQKEITDKTRIVNALPTLQYILDHGGSAVVMSHLGRPQKKLLSNGSVDVDSFTLKNIVPTLSELLKTEVKFASDVAGSRSQELATTLKPGEVLLIENTRFEPGEKTGSFELAKSMSLLGDVYINDAFGTAHRAHASTTTVAQFFEKGSKGFGFLMRKELENGQKVLNDPQEPMVAIIGGAKVSDKIGLISSLLPKCSDICIGGGMAYTFFKAQGGSIGKSLCEDDKLDMARDIFEKARASNTRIHLPEDSICASEFSPEAPSTTHPSADIPAEMMGLDIGPLARKCFEDVISNAGTIVWNGPMGVFEFEAFSEGTLGVAQAVAKATRNGAFSLVGGGDSVSAINKSGLNDQISFISTGGGAMLELLEGKKLPGVTAILD
jgi:phosphoglycerate kinase